MINFSVPYISFYLVKDSYYLLQPDILKSFKYSISGVFLYGAIYAALVSYFCYVPKEKFWIEMKPRDTVLELLKQDDEDDLRPRKKISKKWLEEKTQ